MALVATRTPKGITMEWIIFWIVCMITSVLIARSKGNEAGNAVLWTLLLGPIGVLVALAKPNNKTGIEEKAIASGAFKKCPFCAEAVRKEAIVCRYCGKDIPTPTRTTQVVQISPLMQAVIDDDIGLVESLLKDGANPLEEDAEGRNALQQAQALQYYAMIDLLSTWEAPNEKTT